MASIDVDLPFKLEGIAELHGNSILIHGCCCDSMASGHEDRVWHVSWNPTKPLLASCSADKTVRMYHYKRDPDSSDVIFSHLNSIPTGHTKTVRAISWSPSGETLATASFDSNIGIWEQETSEDDDESPSQREWECASLLEGHETECKSVAYSSTGTLLASCSRDKTVWIWEGKRSLFLTMVPSLTHSKYIRILTSSAWVSSWSIVRM
jgi:WD40 repeat protein